MRGFTGDGLECQSGPIFAGGREETAAFVEFDREREAVRVGRLRKTTDPTGRETHYCYDADGHTTLDAAGTLGAGCT
jgi:hypothetical protein